MGLISGDALGGLVEFMSPGKIQSMYPQGLTEMKSGGTWNTIAGQPTDDSEMTLALAMSILKNKTYDSDQAKSFYLEWLQSNPFDCGITTATGLNGSPNLDSQANGALMRISPIGIFGANFAPEKVIGWAMQDADLTHPHPVCKQANALMAIAISKAISEQLGPRETYDKILEWAEELNVDSSLKLTIENAAISPPKDYLKNQGWVLIAFQNALWQLLNAPDLTGAISNTILRGGDTDTNAAICGALLGAVYGSKAIPTQWLDCIVNCRPEKGLEGVFRPRPQEYWPAKAPEYARQLVSNVEAKEDSETLN